MKKRKQQGFTFVESIVSSLILAIAILGAASQYVSQLRAEANLNIMMQSRLLLEQAKQRFVATPTMFPNASNGGQPIVYVICFNDAGAVRTNQCNGRKDYIGIKFPAGAAGNTALKQPAALPGDCTTPVAGANFVCPMRGTDGTERGGGGIEVHIAWADLLGGPAGTVFIDSLLLPNTARIFGNAKADMTSGTMVLRGPVLRTEVRF